MSVTLLLATIILSWSNDPCGALLFTVLVQMIIFLQLKYVEPHECIWHEFYLTPNILFSWLSYQVNLFLNLIG